MHWKAEMCGEAEREKVRGRKRTMKLSFIDEDIFIMFQKIAALCIAWVGGGTVARCREPSDMYACMFMCVRLHEYK